MCIYYLSITRTVGSGQIIYHGPVLEVQRYFEDLGYTLPSNMDVADFLQEIPTASAKRFIDKVMGWDVHHWLV